MTASRKQSAPRSVKRRGHEIVRGRRRDARGGMLRGGVGTADEIGPDVADHGIGHDRPGRPPIGERVRQPFPGTPAKKR